MKRTHILYTLISLALLLACNDDDNNAYPYGDTHGVNDFVWKGLNSWYFWKSEVPQLQDEVLSDEENYQNLIQSTNPENLFYNLLYDYPNVDKYSWIVDDVDDLIASFSGVNKSNGMNFSLARITSNSDDLIGIVNYVVPNSNADEVDVQRGEVFYEVNGQTLTLSNYRELLNDNVSITFAEESGLVDGQVMISGSVSRTLNSEVIEENPILYYTYFTEGNKKIAYLVYNGFKSNFNDELNEVFAEFQSTGVTDLILDLRYNGGGSLSSAMGLSQMITGQFTGSPFTILKYNENHSEYNETRNLTNQLKLYDYQNGNLVNTGTTTISSLNLNKIYVLTSYSSASASELTISCLEPYIDVVKIGSTTRGKFVGSITLYDDASSDFTDYYDRKRTHNYAMQPIVFAYYNSNNQNYIQGIEPDVQVAFGDYIGTLGAFGDMSDPALNEAMNLILGNASRTIYNGSSIREIESTQTMQRFGSDLYLDEGLFLKD